MALPSDLALGAFHSAWQLWQSFVLVEEKQVAGFPGLTSNHEDTLLKALPAGNMRPCACSTPSLTTVLDTHALACVAHLASKLL